MVPGREWRKVIMVSEKESRRALPQDLSRTSITAHLEAEIVAGRNVVYCASFQIAWDELLDKIIGEPLELQGDPLTARMLNKRLVGKADIAKDCYLAMAGLERDGIVGRVHQALRETFNRSPGLDLTLNSPDDILAYAFLEKSIPFDTEFEAFCDPLPFCDGVLVEAFGVEEPSTAAEQVVILDYRHADDYVIKLQGSPEVDAMLEFEMLADRPRIADDIILAKVRPQPTLLETVQSVLARSSEEGREKALREATQAGRDILMRLSPKLDQGSEVLQIPKIDLEVLHRHSELVNKQLLNLGFEDYFIAEALQAVKFRLDEKGADLSSEAAIEMTLGYVAQRRQFIFDRPFLLCLKERESQVPYLAIWVDNSEFLAHAKHDPDGR
jgi:hypothetical protein